MVIRNRIIYHNLSVSASRNRLKWMILRKNQDFSRVAGAADQHDGLIVTLLDFEVGHGVDHRSMTMRGVPPSSQEW